MGKRKIEFQHLNDAIFTRLHSISLHPPANYEAKRKLLLMFHILKAAFFCFHFQVWDWLASEGKQHFGGHSEREKGVPGLKLKQSISSVYSSGTTFQENWRVEIRGGGHCWRRGNHNLLKSSGILHLYTLLFFSVGNKSVTAKKSYS